MNKVWVTEPHQFIEPKLTSSGFGSVTPKTIQQVFIDTVTKFGDRNALALKRAVNGVTPEEWKFWTWKSYWLECRAFAKSLIYFKVDVFKIVNILGFNSPEWFIANTGSVLAGCISAGIYSTNSSEACLYVSDHSKSEIIVLEGNKQLAKYAAIVNNLQYVKAIVVWDEVADPTLVKQFKNIQIISWGEFLLLGANVSDEEVDARSLSVNPGNCASLIYTSGTTGPPKAVMISHDNITWTSANVCQHYMDLNHTDEIISYLPLSHIAAQMIDIYCLMKLGGCTYFAQPDALKGSLTKTLKQVQPTFFFGVPRVWEKIQEKMVQLGRDGGQLKQALGRWAKSVGTAHSKMVQFGAGGGQPWGYGCANALVFSKIKEALGLSRTKGCFSAAAPIADETVNYFASLDIPVFEVFGQSECTGPHTVSGPRAWKVGYCGRPILGSESIITSQGELCYRGRHIFMGYMHQPDKTAETIDDEGYLHSGDIAEFDENDDRNVPKPSGFMRITGRIKELIIGAGGENVAPVLIENEMKAAMLAISNVMVIGDKRKYLAQLVSLKTEVDSETGLPNDLLAADSLFVAKQIGSTATTYSAAKIDPIWKKYIDDGVKVANKKSISNAQIVQKWRWLPEDFSEKQGDLTPTLKLKRSVVAQKYAGLIDSIYAEDEN